MTSRWGATLLSPLNICASYSACSTVQYTLYTTRFVLSRLVHTRFPTFQPPEFFVRLRLKSLFKSPPCPSPLTLFFPFPRLLLPPYRLLDCSSVLYPAKACRQIVFVVCFDDVFFFSPRRNSLIVLSLPPQVHHHIRENVNLAAICVCVCV